MIRVRMEVKPGIDRISVRCAGGRFVLLQRYGESILPGLHPFISEFGSLLTANYLKGNPAYPSKIEGWRYTAEALYKFLELGYRVELLGEPVPVSSPLQLFMAIDRKSYYLWDVYTSGGVHLELGALSPTFRRILSYPETERLRHKYGEQIDFEPVSEL